MKIQRTPRGFAVATFEDANGEVCSIQNSSACGDDDNAGFIWLGIDKLAVKVFPANYTGWHDLDVERAARAQFPSAAWDDPSPAGPTVMTAARMHLSQQQVRDLLPLLIAFADNGEIE